MSLDCEYPNSCSCGCQDEPVRPGCKCCGRDDRHASGCLIPENAHLRARIAELEAERDEAKVRVKKLALALQWFVNRHSSQQPEARALIEDARRG